MATYMVYIFAQKTFFQKKKTKQQMFAFEKLLP